MNPQSDTQSPAVDSGSVSAWLASLVKDLIAPTAVLGSDLTFWAVSQTWAENFISRQGAPIHTVCPGFPGRWEELFPGETTQASPLFPESMHFLRADETTQINHWKAAVWHGPDGTPCGAIVTLGLGARAPVASPSTPREPPVDSISFGKATRRLAHDFNNIFTVISGGAEWFAMQHGSAFPAVASELLQSVRSGASRGIEVTRKLLALGRNQSLEPGQTDLVKVLTAALAKVKADAPAGIKCVVKVDTQQVCPVFLDARQFDNALIELTRNAFEAMPHGGTLTISLTVNAKASNCVISIEDTGCGIPAKIAGDVTAPLFTTKGGTSHGLGLAIAHDFVVRSGGTFEIISSEGNGCRIVIILPVKDFHWTG